MGQVTIYLDKETEKKMQAAARARKLSKSKYIATLIAEVTADHWPADVVQLAGAWGDLACAQEIRSGLGADVPREDV